MKSILSADIGGTNSRFGVFRVGTGGGMELTHSMWLETHAAKSLAGLFNSLPQSGFPLTPDSADAISIAVPGPVEGNICKTLINVPWQVDLAEAFDRRILERAFLINDLTAQAHACLLQEAGGARMILEGRPAKNKTLAVMGAGTGLGHAALVPDKRGGYTVMPSEGGQAQFPFEVGPERDYADFLLEKTGFPFITGETVVSGRGLSYAHWFLTGKNLPAAEAALEMDEHSQTMAWMARFTARAARQLAVMTLSRAGIYLTGGLIVNNPEMLSHPEFAEEFRNSPTMGNVLEEMPVYLMTNPESGLWGAALFAKMRMGW